MSYIKAFNTAPCDDCPMPKDHYRRGQCGITITPFRECRVKDAMAAPEEPGEVRLSERPGGPFVDVRDQPWIPEEEYRAMIRANLANAS